MKLDIQTFARPNIVALTPYSSARDEFRGQASIYLDANENPFAREFGRYPDARQQKIRKAVARLKKVKSTELLVTHGSDEAIDLLMRAFCVPGTDRVLVTEPSYGIYAAYTHINGLLLDRVPLDNSFDLDVDAILKISTPSTKLIFLCSPNNPTGNVLTTSKVEQLLGTFHGLVVIDEAYIDFAETPSWVKRRKQFPNLVVLHTFSKAWGLAGLRLGACVAGPEVIDVLMKIKPPYNLGSFDEQKLLQTLDRNMDNVRTWVNSLKREREALSKALRKFDFVLEVFPSQANFLLVRVEDAPRIYRGLLRNGIVVRDRSSLAATSNCLRISIGTPSENKFLLKTLRSL